jgi:hypothetical protein
MRAHAQERVRHVTSPRPNTKTDVPVRARDVRSCSSRPGQICKSVQRHTQIRRQSVRDQGVVFLTRALTFLFVRFTFLPAHSSQSSHFLASALLAPSLSFSCSCYIAIARCLSYFLISQVQPAGSLCIRFLLAFAVVFPSLFRLAMSESRMILSVCDRVHTHR